MVNKMMLDNLSALMGGSRNITGIYKNFVRTTDAVGVNRMYELVDNQLIFRRASQATVQEPEKGMIQRLIRKIYPLQNGSYETREIAHNYRLGDEVSTFWGRDVYRQQDRICIRDNDVTNLSEATRESLFSLNHIEWKNIIHS